MLTHSLERPIVNSPDFNFLDDIHLDPIFYIAEHAKRKPHSVAISGVDFRYTYRELVNVIDNLALFLSKAGLQRGQLVKIAVKQIEIGFLISLALQKIGCACLLPGSELARRTEQADICILMSGDVIGNANRHIYFEPHWLSTAEAQVAFDNRLSGYSDASDIALVTLSSGTTGTPKRIRTSFRKLYNGVRGSILHENHIATLSPCLVSFGFGAFVSYRQMLTILWSGGTLVFAELGVDAAAQLPSLKVRHIFTSIYNLRTWLEIAKQKPEYFAQIELITVGGAVLTPQLEAEVRKHMCNRIAIHYGSSETGLIAAGSADLRGTYPDAVGVVLSSVRLEIVDANGFAVAEGTSGSVRVWLGGQAAKSEDIKLVDGWFYTGDAGIIESGRVLRIFGRNDGITNIGGMKIRLDDIEDSLKKYSGISDVALFTVEDHLGETIVCCAYVPKESFQLAELQLGFKELQLPAVLLETGSLPRSPDGKILRHILKQGYEEFSKRP